MQPPPKSPNPDDFEALLAECIEVLGSLGPDGLEAHLTKNPKTADDLRARLSTLARLGMLPDASEDDSETATIGPYLVLR
ncbi:MAG: hypothetical protein ACI8X5_003984, partial [Planctomycetota bacterium]